MDKINVYWTIRVNNRVKLPIKKNSNFFCDMVYSSICRLENKKKFLELRRSGIFPVQFLSSL